MIRRFLCLLESTCIIALLFILVSSCKKSATNVGPGIIPAQPVTPADTTRPTYALVWSDEFNGTAVDTTKWVFENRNPGVNNEKEYYQQSNVSFANGNLVITAKKQTVGGQPYTSGKITTFGKFSQQYGRIESRIAIPMGAGMWPAFWMMGANVDIVNWPTCGEIDIMEHVNADNIIYGTMHWNVNGHVSYGGTTTTTPANFHVYAVEWDTNYIRWYVDNTLYITGKIANNVNGTDAFHLPFFLILNLAVGGDFPNTTIDDSKIPATMLVDYVRVYKAG